MNDISSGCYVIDSQYNIVSLNETAEKTYPQLKTGEKCYRCLMNLDEPCELCPVKNGRKGPNTYTDPIRGIIESVDAVELELPEKGLCHAIVFSTVGNAASAAASLPLDAADLHTISLIWALTLEYNDVLMIHPNADKVQFFRNKGQMVERDSERSKVAPYEKELKKYIDRFVCDEDKERMWNENCISNLKNRLNKEPFFTTHYSVIQDGERHYYRRMIARVGDEENWDSVVVGVRCEDEIIKIRKNEEDLRHNLAMVEYDAKTSLYTREAFLYHGDQLRKKYPDTKFDFCIMKIENFRLLNRHYGRAQIDRLLDKIGRMLKEYDDEYTCLAYLGDGMYASFTENIPNILRRDRVLSFRDDILDSEPIEELSMKWSVYVKPKPDQEVEAIIENALYALQIIRASVREDYIEFDQNVIDRMEMENRIEREFEQAVLNEEFALVYQPKFSLKTGKIIGAEALVRWNKKNGETVLPDNFIPVLERSGQIHRLDLYVFEKTCVFLSRLKELNLQIPISVNLSRVSMFRRDTAMNYRLIAKRYDIDPRYLPIEVTESATIRPEVFRECTGTLINQGFVLHMDDFGTGYSSLASLQEVPFECIKIDKELVDHLSSEHSNGILKFAIAFAKESGKSVIAEGVENYEQYLILKFAGCDSVQGFYMSKPLSERQLIEKLTDSMPIEPK